MRIFSGSIASLAAWALREELASFPKPGLVSHEDNGSHPDLNAGWFLKSIDALEPNFAALAEAGAREASFAGLQMIGLEAERSMLAATEGRNTHRGAIFCLGLMVAAAGYRSMQPTSPGLGEIVRAVWGPDIPGAAGLSANSHGLQICQSLGVGGVREEARAGFPTVFQHGLPAYIEVLGPHGHRAACVQSFFTMLTVCEDTTLLQRGGMEGQTFARRQAARFLAEGGVNNPDWLTLARSIHTDFVARNLTAGGVADLLAVTLFAMGCDNAMLLKNQSD